jgi:hypothetical protein
MNEGRPPATFQPSRHAHRKHEPEARGELADAKPPHWMLKRQKRIWRERMSCAPKGILRTVDFGTFTAYVLHVDTLIEAAKAQNNLALLDADGRLSALLRLQRQVAEVMVRVGRGAGFHPGFAVPT